MPRRRFVTIARRRQAAFRATSRTISAAGRSPSDEQGQRHGHLLALGYEHENLYPGLREPGPCSAKQFFADRGIKWWRSTRSGDRKGSDGPTRNLASSQIACVNFLLPLTEHPDALIAVLRSIDNDVRDVVPLEYEVPGSNRSVESLVEFEWVGCKSSLEGKRQTRGANVTSADALIVAELMGGGRRGYFLEWKYAEEYTQDKYKGGDTRSGKRRLSCYRDRYAATSSPFRSDIPIEHMLWDPFYQLMRLGLLGAKMLEEPPEFRITQMRVVVVCPNDNAEYRSAITAPELKERFRECASIAEVFQAVCRDKRFFRMTSPEELLQTVSAVDAGGLANWIAYQRARYDGET